MDLNLKIEDLNFFTAAQISRWKKLGLETVKDLLYYFPNRYEDFSNILSIAHVLPEEKLTIRGWLTKLSTKVNRTGRVFLLEGTIEDETGKIKAVWYNQPFLYQVLKKGKYYSFAGKVVEKDGETFLSNPFFEEIDLSNQKKNIFLNTSRLVPIYPETKGIRSKWIRKMMFSFLNYVQAKLKEFLPQSLLTKENFMPFPQAIMQIHFPDSEKNANEARRRFEFEEIFLLQLKVLKIRKKIREKKSFAIPINLERIKQFLKTLPFELTDSQKIALWQILKDMEKNRPMNRLLQGDVGSGKTMVALISAFNAALAGYQSALLAPTEILARQHYNVFEKFLKNEGIKIKLLTRGTKKGKNDVLNNDFDIVIGTHTLLQEKLNTNKLALVIFDEQHRFGVEQRGKIFLSQKIVPHFFSMTATPIPRTLALTIYGDLDFSLLKELPKGRKRVETFVFQPKELNKMYKMMEKELEEGGQIFVVCPRVEMKEKGKLISELRAVKEEIKKLKTTFPNVKIKMIYGKMKSQEKEKIMKEFEEKKIRILVATNVIEEGIDVPGATLIVIENAERFGLSQLYQLRGRVGRGEQQGKCFLVTHLPTEKSAKRLEALLNADNAFELAMKDLEIRGPGDFLSKKQTGMPDLKIANLTNVELIEKSRNYAKNLLKKDPHFLHYPELKKILGKIKMIHLE